jgi:orotidine-5'-phosphate decarboxylase
VGLDTAYAYLPEHIKNSGASLSQKIFSFNKAVIDATADIACCYKLQSAYYEAMGIEGMCAYAATLGYLKQEGLLSIADVKRSDIADTAKMYAQAIFDGDFEADMATLNAYMGSDTIEPFGPYLEKGKAVFVLVKTSNPSAVDFENLDCSGSSLSEMVASKVGEWGEMHVGESGFSSVGAVIGINRSEDAARLLERMPRAFLLIPGYGAQGGSGAMLESIFRNGICGVVNASRSVICAHLKQGLDRGFERAARSAASAMQEDVCKWQ